VCPKCHFENPPGFKFCGQCTTALGSDSINPPSSNTAITIRETDGWSILDGERKTVTALFADIKGSMELMEDLDPEEARAIVDPAVKLKVDRSTATMVASYNRLAMGSSLHSERQMRMRTIRSAHSMRRFASRKIFEGRATTRAELP
jgi:hypothetical protein